MPGSESRMAASVGSTDDVGSSSVDVSAASDGVASAS